MSRHLEKDVMPRYLVKCEEFYIVWSTIVDAPVVICNSKKEILDYWKEKYGSEGLKELLVFQGKDLSKVPELDDETVSGNRAGRNESELTKDEIYRVYCLGEKIDGWSPFKKQI